MSKTAWVLMLFLVGECTSFSQDRSQTDFKKLTLEELMDVDVTSVTRTPESLDQTPAAISVITSEDIRRSGVTNIAEALRLVPGMDVARINASTWAVSARGFNSVLSVKMLVLVDGRTAYSPIFAGVFWELQNFVLDNIERIEVIRGPGATLWATNAMNGVVNIITKTAYRTEGVSVVATGGGAQSLGISSVRVGKRVNADTSYRFSGQYSYQDQLVLPDGEPAQDSSRFGSAAFRLDSTRGRDQLTLQAGAYRGLEGVFGLTDGKVLGGYLAGQWNRQISANSSVQLQLSYERLLRRVPPPTDVRQRILDIDFQHRFSFHSHTVTWGGEYRWNNDSTFPATLQFVPREKTYPLAAAFVQDEIPLMKDRLKLEIGSKFERNDFTGFEVEPSVRASFAIRPERYLWAAVTRAVRSPTRLDTDSRVLVALQNVTLDGNKDFKSEDLVAFEVGYRSKLTQRTSIDAATFFN